MRWTSRAKESIDVLTPEERFQQSLTAISIRIERTPRIVFACLLLALTLVRDGVNLFSQTWSVTAESIERLPEATSYGSWSWGNLLVAKLLAVDSSEAWYALHIALTIVCLTLPLLLARRFPHASFYPFALYWLLLPVVGSLLMWVGMYDVASVLGAVIVAFSSRWWQAAIGAIVWSSGNPEQAVIGTLIFLLVTATEALRKQRKVAAFALATSGLGLVASRIFITGSDAPSRSGLLRPVNEGLLELIYGWPESIWGWNGVIWFALVAIALAVGRRDRLILLFALVAVPAAAVFVTYDWNRVYWLVAVAALVALGRRFSTLLAERSPAVRGGVLAAGVLAVLIVPPANGGFFFLLASVSDLLG